MPKSLGAPNLSRLQVQITAIRTMASSVAMSTLVFTNINGWGVIFNLFQPPSPYDSPGKQAKQNKVILTGDFPPSKKNSGDPILVYEFLFLESNRRFDDTILYWQSAILSRVMCLVTRNHCDSDSAVWAHCGTMCAQEESSTSGKGSAPHRHQ